MDEKLFKIVFELPVESDTWPPFATESLWGAKTATKMQVRLRNTPFFVLGVSYDDLVLVRVDHDVRELVFQELLEESGHSTIHVLVKDTGAMDRVKELISASGCSREIGTTDDYLAIDVPPDVSYAAVREKLRILKDQGLIGVNESAISTLHKGQLQ